MLFDPPSRKAFADCHEVRKRSSKVVICGRISFFTRYKIFIIRLYFSDHHATSRTIASDHHATPRGDATSRPLPNAPTTLPCPPLLVIPSGTCSRSPPSSTQAHGHLHDVLPLCSFPRLEATRRWRWRRIHGCGGLSMVPRKAHYGASTHEELNTSVHIVPV